ncbi:hypothetical protein N0V95_006682 [Ascochyta clinopodiicola]|nr:hypothetical protein N0V95_006682 [Ascochyta clinopodiicola]
MLLTREERKALIATARRAVGPSFPIMAGVGSHSTAQTLEFIADAATAGANSVLVLPCCYFGGATTPQVLENFYGQVAARSALPIVIYNFPGVCNGVDLSSDFIEAMAKRHSNIVGVKLTCGSVAKITRLAAALPKEKFAVFGGQADFIIGGLSSGSSGCIAAFANVAPRCIVRINELYHQGKHAEALYLHQKTALAEQAIKGGIAPTKFAAAIHSATYAGIQDAPSKMAPRRPYVAPAAAVQDMVKSRTAEIGRIEQSLPLINRPISSKI